MKKLIPASRTGVGGNQPGNGPAIPGVTVSLFSVMPEKNIAG
jgi:hypothetical protein